MARPSAYPAVIPMARFQQPAEWRTSAANSQFVYIALIFSSQGLWYTIGTVKMTATSSLYMIPPHTKIKP